MMDLMYPKNNHDDNDNKYFFVHDEYKRYDGYDHSDNNKLINIFVVAKCFNCL